MCRNTARERVEDARNCGKIISASRGTKKKHRDAVVDQKVVVLAS